MHESILGRYRMRLRLLRRDPRFQGRLLLTAWRLLLWRVRCALNRPAVVPLPSWKMQMWLPSQWRGGAKMVYVLRDHTETDLGAILSVLQPGNVVIDAGANIGLLSIAFARAVGPTGSVLAVEPATASFAALSQQVDINHLSQVAPIHAALADKPGTMRLYHHADPSRNSLFPDRSERGEEVTVTTIDHLMTQSGLDRVDVLKIDVEGAEELVLKGAERALQSNPTIIFEMHSAASKRSDDPFSAWTFLADRGYQFSIASGDTMIPATVPPTGFANVIAMHQGAH